MWHVKFERNTEQKRRAKSQIQSRAKRQIHADINTLAGRTYERAKFTSEYKFK